MYGISQYGTAKDDAVQVDSPHSGKKIRRKWKIIYSGTKPAPEIW
jgi:hypothetical protein